MDNILGVDKLKSSILNTITLFFIALLIIIEYMVFSNQTKIFEEQKEEIHQSLHKTIKHTFNHSKNQYTFLLKRAVNVKGIKTALKNDDREALYKTIKPKFDMLKEENPYLRTFHFIKKDGTSYLRVHKSEHFGDDVKKLRPMVQEALKTKQIVLGHETCKYLTAFRVIVPVFIDNEFWGTFGLGIDPDYFIAKIGEIINDKGAVFIRNTNIDFSVVDSKYDIKDYRLHTKVDNKFLDILKHLPKDYNFEDNVKISYKHKSYIVHTTQIKDYNDKAYGYYLFLNDASKMVETESNTRFLVTIVIMFFIILIYLIIRYYIVKFTKDIEKFYLNVISKLEKNENYLKAVEDNSSNIIVTAFDRKIVTGNKMFLDFTDYKSVEKFREEHDCICDLFIKRVGYLSKYIDETYWVQYILENPNDIHKAIMEKDENEYIFSVTASKMQFGETIRYVITFVDITDIEIIKDRYEIAINGTDDGIWDWNLRTNEVYFSQKWKSMLGYDYHEIPNALQTWNERVHPDDLANALKDINDNIEKRTKNYENIHRLRHKDGSWVWILDRGKTIFDDDGNAIRMVGFHTNITKQKELERELNKLKMVIEQSPLSIVITDSEGHLEYVNPWFTKVTGYSYDEVIGQNPRLLKSGYTSDAEYKQLWKEITHEHVWRGTFKNIKKDGSEFWERAIIVPIDDQQGNIVNYLAIKQEITEELHLKQEMANQEEVMIAQSRNAAMGEMISMIAHQWRQPLSIISMGANNILADIELDMLDEKILKEISQEIIEQTNQLSEIIDDFREFFKPIKNTSKLFVKDVLKDSLNVIGKSIQNNNIELIQEIDNTTQIVTYERELLHVFINILNNAKEALSNNQTKNKFIKVKISESDDFIEINISDNAGGIEKENIDKIFNPYFTTKEEQNGTGIGLYMVKTIVEKHLNGTVKAYNLKDGANFEIKISKVNKG